LLSLKQVSMHISSSSSALSVWSFSIATCMRFFLDPFTFCLTLMSHLPFMTRAMMMSVRPTTHAARIICLWFLGRSLLGKLAR